MNTITITDPIRLREAMEFARNAGCLDQFARDLCKLLQVLTGGMAGPNSDQIVEIGPDFAPHSFTFAVWRGERERGSLLFNGGWIYDGPGAPGDGSFPSLSVNLNRLSSDAPKHSWNVHT